MTKEIIRAIIYTIMDEQLGPNPLIWDPIDLSEDIRMAVGIKSITMLSTDRGVIPRSIVIMPFPNLNLKGIIKYNERRDDTYRGNAAVSSIALLFDEAYDTIFYKYLDYFESSFSRSAQKIIELENKKAKSDEIYIELISLRNNISEILNDLHEKEKSSSKMEAFPEEQIEEVKKLKYSFKIVICGDPGVGKTSTILRFTDDAFTRTYIPTLGVNISEKNIKINKIYVKLILWDIAGQIKFEAMRRHFYKGSEAVILIFDLSNRKTFENITNWFKDIRNYTKSESNLVGFILGNKEDLINDRTVNHEEAYKVAQDLNLEYIETSALTGKNVEESFYRVAEKLINSKIKKKFI